MTCFRELEFSIRRRYVVLPVAVKERLLVEATFVSAVLRLVGVAAIMLVPGGLVAALLLALPETSGIFAGDSTTIGVLSVVVLLSLPLGFWFSRSTRGLDRRLAVLSCRQMSAPARQT